MSRRIESATARRLRALALVGIAAAACGCFNSNYEGAGAEFELGELEHRQVRLGLDLQMGVGSASGTTSRDGLYAPSSLRGRVVGQAAGMLQIETDEAMLWIPWERVLFVELE